MAAGEDSVATGASVGAGVTGAQAERRSRSSIMEKLFLNIAKFPFGFVRFSLKGNLIFADTAVHDRFILCNLSGKNAGAAYTDAFFSGVNISGFPDDFHPVTTAGAAAVAVDDHLPADEIEEKNSGKNSNCKNYLSTFIHAINPLALSIAEISAIARGGRIR